MREPFLGGHMGSLRCFLRGQSWGLHSGRSASLALSLGLPAHDRLPAHKGMRWWGALPLPLPDLLGLGNLTVSPVAVGSPR